MHSLHWQEMWDAPPEPTYVGMISSALNDNLKLGIFAALIFPILMMIGIKLIMGLRKNA